MGLSLPSQTSQHADKGALPRCSHSEAQEGLGHRRGCTAHWPPSPYLKLPSYQQQQQQHHHPTRLCQKKAEAKFTKSFMPAPFSPCTCCFWGRQAGRKFGDSAQGPKYPGYPILQTLLRGLAKSLHNPHLPTGTDRTLSLQMQKLKARFKVSNPVLNIHSFIPTSQVPHEVDTNIIPILQTRRLRVRKGKALAQGYNNHTVCQEVDSNPCLSDSGVQCSCPDKLRGKGAVERAQRHTGREQWPGRWV